MTIPRRFLVDRSTSIYIGKADDAKSADEELLDEIAQHKPIAPGLPRPVSKRPTRTNR